MRGFKLLEKMYRDGHLVEATDDHIGALSKDKQKAELAIRSGSSLGILRAKAVYAFEDYEVAAELIDETKWLHEVRFEAQDIIHRGDLRIYDEVVEALKNEEDISSLVLDFWSGATRQSPRIELALRKAIVQKAL